jgi:hypothetical protein
MRKKLTNRLLWFISFAPQANFEIALSGSAVSYVLGVKHQFPNPLLYSAFIFFGTLFIYNLMRAVSLWRLLRIQMRQEVFMDLRSHYGIAAICGIIALLCVLFLMLPLAYYLLLSVILLLSLAYRFRWFKIGHRRAALSELPHTKTIVLSVVWATLTVYMPTSFSSFDGTLFLSASLMYAAISIPFDVRDLDKDDPSRKTLAQIFGKQNALIMSGITFCIALLLILNWSSPSVLLCFVLATTFYFYLLKNISRSNQNNMMLRFVDLTPILWVIFH